MWLCYICCLRVLYLVCDVLLLCRGVTFGVNESGVCYQVPSVLHYEAPTVYTHICKSADNDSEFFKVDDRWFASDKKIYVYYLFKSSFSQCSIQIHSSA